jgi:hypothetical protein
LVKLNGTFVAHPSTHTSYHKIVCLMNEAEPSVYFDWGEGWLQGGPPYFVYYLGEYNKAKETYLKCLDRINEILHADLDEVNKSRIGLDRLEWFPLLPDDVVGENLYTAGQALK